MQSFLSNLVDNLSEINNKEPNKFMDIMRSVTDSLSQFIDKISKIDQKISQNEFTDNMRSTLFSLTQSIDKVSEIDRKIAQIDKKEADNTFTDGMRSMVSALSQSLDKISKIDNDISKIEDYTHAQKVWDVLKIKNLGEYHDLYAQSDTALLADVFESFRDKCFEIYELDPAHFLSAPGLAWQACLKKAQVELELLTDNDLLLMFEEGI